MTDTRVERAGIVAAILLALCCLTPALFGLVSLVGVSAIFAYLGFVSVAVIALLAVVVFYAMSRRQDRLNGERLHR